MSVPDNGLLEDIVFNILESNWDHSARRRWAALASFAMQAFGLSLLLLISLMTVQDPPLLRWFETAVFTPPPAPAPVRSGRTPVHSTNLADGRLQEPLTIPSAIAVVHESSVGSVPDLNNIGAQGGIGSSRLGVLGSLGPSVAIAPPAIVASTRPLKISHWAEGNLVYRVQPSYPQIARQSGLHGTVELRATISRTGTIENLVVVSGHPFLVKAAIDAVRQWRYRPYLLNNKPIEVETEITVNFVLAGS